MIKSDKSWISASQLLVKLTSPHQQFGDNVRVTIPSGTTILKVATALLQSVVLNTAARITVVDAPFESFNTRNFMVPGQKLIIVLAL